ncbi:hypothetical protein PA598K_03931 [Paenibacillus sp. 598K]|uniref:hypothetical protein n=1 Tax=Paenibacillus sp. 598K TaxID=1117987 RepID=UPI000FFA45F8|nr:hypothetical protein [Paenibacillus sp. 598K]GBF75515.1 hypothetical protein PA598K_03931 [Paenibacillus sp. 598K]
MGALTLHFKATYRQLKMYIWFVLVIIVFGRLTELIITSLTEENNVSRLSETNMLIILLPLIAIVLPLSYTKRMVHLGATRQQVFWGLHGVYAIWAVLVALINSLWVLIQMKVFHNYANVVDLVDAFHWNDFGFLGTLLYQTAFYLMAMALLSMLTSGYSSPVGWLLSALLLTAIPLGTAISSLRVYVSSFFQTLLFNDSLLLGVGYNLLLYLLFAAGGWLFTRVRAH